MEGRNGELMRADQTESCEFQRGRGEYRAVRDSAPQQFETVSGGSMPEIIEGRRIAAASFS